MSKLLKEWNKLAFKKRNRSINEMYDDGFGNVYGDDEYSDYDNDGQEQANVEAIFQSMMEALNSGQIKLSIGDEGNIILDYGDLVEYCEVNWFETPPDNDMARAHREFQIGIRNGQIWDQPNKYTQGKWVDGKDKINEWMA